MANLLGANIGTNYKGILNLGTTVNTQLTTTVIAITDGMGNESPLQLSSNVVGVGTNLGIGTTTPNFKLNLYGTSALYNIGTNAAFSANNNYFIGHGLNDSTPANITSKIGFISDATVGSFSDAIAFYTSPTAFVISPSDSSNERMRITNSGRVGIGTTGPSAKLEVKDTAESFQIKIDGGGASQEGIRSAASGNLASYNPATYDFQFGPLQMNPAFYTISFAGQNILFGNVSSGTIPLKNSVGCGNSGISQGFNSISISDAYNLGVGTPTPNASAKLDITSTTQGVLFPRMTTTQKNAIASPTAGLVVYDTTLNKLCVRTNSAWQTITSV
jgi:hypothetical protein